MVTYKAVNNHAFLDIDEKDLFLFTGGVLCSPSFKYLNGSRNYIAHFEEYVRWTKTKNDEKLKERYVINTAYPGQSISILNKEFKRNIKQYRPSVVLYLLSPEDYLNKNNTVEEYGEKLSRLIQLVLQLRNNQGKFVLQYPWKTRDSKENTCMKKYIEYIKKNVVSKLEKEQRNRVLIVDYYSEIGLLSVDNIITEDNYLNKKGHLKIGEILVSHLYGEVESFPGKDVKQNLYTVKHNIQMNSQNVFKKNQNLLLKLVNAKESMTWLFMGDSITHGALWTFGYDSYVQLFEKYIKNELARKHDVFLNTAVSGATIPSTLNRLKYRLNSYSPDVIHIMLGANDSVQYSETQYRENLELLLEQAFKKEASVILSTPTPSMLRNRPRQIPRYVQNINEIVNKNPNVILIDQYTLLKDILNQNKELWKQEFTFYTDDSPLHLGANGHLFMFYNLVKQLKVVIEDSQMLNYVYLDSKDNELIIKNTFNRLN